jgi:hypothetical protein
LGELVVCPRSGGTNACANGKTCITDLAEFTAEGAGSPYPDPGLFVCQP